MEATLTQSDIDRFWSKVDKTSTCWLWTDALAANGYGTFSVHVGVSQWRTARAHRIAVILSGRTIPDDLVVDHICRVRHCVNPDHLRVVTRAENTLIGIGPTAIHARKTHCGHGHEFTAENTYVRPSRPTERACRACLTVAQMWTCPKCGNEMRRGNRALHQRIPDCRTPGKRSPKTHCKRGHEFIPENTIHTKDGRRKCRCCEDARIARRTAKRRAER